MPRRLPFNATLPALCGIAVLLAACGTSKDDPRYRAYRAKECSIYFTIDGYLKESGRASSSSLFRGCPQSAANIADMSSVDEAAQPTGALADRLHGQLISRGAPRDVADIVRRSHAFRQWVELARAAGV